MRGTLNCNKRARIFSVWSSKTVMILAALTLAGMVSGSLADQVYYFTNFAGSLGSHGAQNGTGSSALFYAPTAMALDSGGNLYVADTSNNVIRQVTASGSVSTFVGASAGLNQPYGVAYDRLNNVLYVSDTLNHVIRKVTMQGVATTFAGTWKTHGSYNGLATSSTFYNPTGIAVDGAGNVYVADTSNDEIRLISNGMVSKVAGTPNYVGVKYRDGSASVALFNSPEGIAVDSSGTIYVADTYNHRIRLISSGMVSTFAGSGAAGPLLDGIGTAANLNLPIGLSIDGANNLYVADSANHAIRLITTAQQAVSTLGGNGISGSRNGLGNVAQFNQPFGVVVDSARANLYVGDTWNQVIRLGVLQLGSVKVTLLPAAATNIGAAWNVDDKGPYASGAVVSGLSIGNHTLTFTPVPGWSAPPQQTVQTQPGQTNNLQATYTQLGYLSVTITPPAAASNAQWSVDGGTTWYISGATNQLVPGNYSVTFFNLGGWDTPQSVPVTVVAGLMATASGNYHQETGALQVNLSPADAVAAGAAWQVDSLGWQTNRAIVTGLLSGNHAMTFSNIYGWTAPASQQVLIAGNVTNQASFVYTQQFGSVRVTIYPVAAANANAQWSVDGGATWYASDAVVPNITLGSHTVSYSTISGWNTPFSQTITVSPNTTTVTNATYVQQSGWLQVALSPQEAVNAGAQWQVDGGPLWQTNGAVVGSLLSGNHTVTFSNIFGWTAPASQQVLIAGNVTNQASFVYTQQFGSVLVNITPTNAAQAGAMWRVNGQGWQASGTAVPNVLIGSATISYLAINGWTAPADRTVTVNFNQTTNVTAVYTQQFASLQVSLTPPEAVEAGAQWRLDTTGWQTNGATVSHLTVGPHTVTFLNVTNWVAPSIQQVNLSGNQAASFSFNYTPAPGSVQVFITPTALVKAGAQWRLDGGPSQSSGTTLSNVSAGQHTLTFSHISGWNEPAGTTITVQPNQTSVSRWLYVAATGASSLQVSILPPEAATAGALWQVDYGPWQNSGATVTGLNPGSHVVNFSALGDWGTPSSQLVVTAPQRLLATSGVYTQQFGSLQMFLTPSNAIAGGAMWQVDGGLWQPSGATVTGLPVGNHSVAYAAASGYNAPASTVLTATAGTKFVLTNTYVLGGCSTPTNLVLNGDFEASLTNWSSWNYVSCLSNGPSGSYCEIIGGGIGQELPTVPGCVYHISVQARCSAPVTNYTYLYFAGSSHSFEWPTNPYQWADYEIDLSASNNKTLECYCNNEAGGFDIDNIQVIPSSNLVQVVLGPAGALVDGAKWQVDGSGWQSSGATISVAYSFTHTVTFKTLTNWTAPASQIFVLLNDGTNLSGVYLPQGSIQVTAAPVDSVLAGARWRLDGGPWQNMGTTLPGVTVGNHTVNFALINGWITPPDQTVTITSGLTNSIVGKYFQQFGSITVSLCSSNAINDGALWQVDGGAWLDSDSVVSGLAIGSHAVGFIPVDGWSDPVGYMVTVVPGQTNLSGGTYQGLYAFETIGGLAGARGTNNGPIGVSRFTSPAAAAVDPSGNLYVADSENHLIRMLTPITSNTWIASTIAGTGGFYGNNDGIGSAARFYYPQGIAVDSNTNVYVADTYNNSIRKLTQAGGTWAVTTIATGFNHPSGIAVDSGGSLYVADTYNSAIKKLTQAGSIWTVSTLADHASGFFQPQGIAVDMNTNIFMADTANHTIRLLNPATGLPVRTVAGTTGVSGSADGTNSAATFNRPFSVAVDNGNAVYVADTYNSTIRKLVPVGTNWVVSTIGGVAGNLASADGIGTCSRFNIPAGVALDSSGNLYVTDMNNDTIRRGVSLVPPGPILQTSGAKANPLAFTWTAAARQNYQIQYTTNLSQGSWLNWGGVQTASNGPVSVSVPGGADPRRFYRIVLLP